MGKIRIMVEKSYKKISQNLISDLKGKEKEVILRRYGLEGIKRETLQSIGNSFEITRERVRQIQVSAEKKIKERLGEYKEVFE
ncbi:MAG: sigma factor-like helix-turn-helix DNA-binding protein, partial [Caldimicrobium sp.]